MNIVIIGDVHGQFETLKNFLDQLTEYKIGAAIVCGDYGIWTDFYAHQWVPKKYRQEYPVPVYFCDGNHENHFELDKYERGQIHQITDHSYFCAFGSTLTLDGHTFLFCGGADSIDKKYRFPGVSWWPTELISEADMEYLPDKEIQTIISHTCPKSIVQSVIDQTMIRNAPKCKDPSIEYLEQVKEKYHPKNWFFGHWHIPFKTIQDGISYHGLANLPDSGKILRVMLNPLIVPDWFLMVTTDEEKPVQPLGTTRESTIQDTLDETVIVKSKSKRKA